MKTRNTGASAVASGEVSRPGATVARCRRAAALAAASTLALTALAGCADDSQAKPASSPSSSSSSATPTKPKKISAATTFKTIEGLPKDNSSKETDGKVVHPKKKQDIYDSPDGDVVARLPVKELGNPTWVPVVESKSRWLRILLPSRPNGATGWIKSSKALETAYSKQVIKVDVDARTLTLHDDGEQVGEWNVATGKAKTPTPRVRTYLMASIIDKKQKKYTPVVLPLGAHSDTLDTFGGGPGTVAIHGWSTDPKVFGHAVTNGCIRVPADALSKLRSVPLGSLVIIQ